MTLEDLKKLVFPTGTAIKYDKARRAFRSNTITAKDFKAGNTYLGVQMSDFYKSKLSPERFYIEALYNNNGVIRAITVQFHNDTPYRTKIITSKNRVTRFVLDEDFMKQKQLGDEVGEWLE